MRRLLTRRLRSRRYDERGAFAIIFAVCAVMLMVMSAFTVDLGQAYVSKRQLQTAADAGALAAAQVYQGQTKPCATLKQDAVLTAQAQAAADAWAVKNYSGVTGTPITVNCNSTTSLTVSYGTSGSTPQVFGQLASGHGSITTARDAAATIGAGVAGDMRPWGICSNIVAQATNLGVVVFVPMLDGSTTGRDSASICGNDHPPGNWWVAECLGQGQGQPETIAAVQDGCSGSYQAVPGQTSSMSPTQLSAFLRDACPGSNDSTSTCLAGDNGNNFHNASDAWQTLVGQSFTMPVFCVSSQCSPMAQTGQGSHGTYAIYRIATVTLCGFKLNPRSASTGWPTTGPCATNNPNNYTSNSVTNGGGFFVVVTDVGGGPTGTDYVLPQYVDSSLTK
jgi:Flp pilus assembly protein TadG